MQQNLPGIFKRKSNSSYYLFKVNFADVWQEIKLNSKLELDFLINAILEQFSVEWNYLYFIEYSKEGKTLKIDAPWKNTNLRTDEVSINELGIQPGDKLKLVYNPESPWVFEIILNKIITN